MQKKLLRQELQQELSSLSKPLYEHLSYIIAQKLLQERAWKEAKIVGITISKPPEVDTFQLIRKAWEEDKKVVVPKCYPKTREMVFRQLTRFDQLESVYSQLLEPIELETKLVDKDEIDLLLVPGLGFSREGYRLGFGGGYYDRFLEDYKGNTISLAFHKQIVDSLPVESHDLPVRKIITDKEIIFAHD